MNTLQQTQITTYPQARVAAFVALALGTLLLLTVGFAPAVALHNPAHDTRHTIGFPCH